jgi:hypothetical protein
MGKMYDDNKKQADREIAEAETNLRNAGERETATSEALERAVEEASNATDPAEISRLEAKVTEADQEAVLASTAYEEADAELIRVRQSWGF